MILSARDPRRGLIVAAANLVARGEGIKAGMRLAEATALSNAQVRDHDPQEDLETLCHLAEQAQQFSPIVGLEQLEKKMWAGRTLHQPECLLLDVTGLANLFGGEEQLLSEVCQWLNQQNYFGCLGLAANVGAAWAIANYANRKHPAPQATDGSLQQAAEIKTVPPSRYRIVSAGCDAEAISHLPLAALRQPAPTIESLARLGLRRVGELNSLPRDGMATRLGEQLILRWDQALGRRAEPIVTLHSLPDWCLEQSLEFPTHHRETIAELVRRLCDELCTRLRKRGEGALRILCRLDLVQQAPLVLQLALFRPTNDAKHLASLLVGQLEQQLRSTTKAALWRISLQATLTAPMRWRQTELFEAGEAASQNEIARLVDTLSGRLGRKQVLQAKLRRESQPELAFSMRPLTGRRQDGSPQTSLKKISTRLTSRRAEPRRDDPLRRPLYLFVQPILISGTTPQTTRRVDNSSAHAIADTPETKSTLPISFHYAEERYDVMCACGPERLESGWWRGPSVRRDYFRVQTRQGSWWWMFRDLHTGHWFLHGRFD